MTVETKIHLGKSYRGTGRNEILHIENTVINSVQAPEKICE